MLKSGVRILLWIPVIVLVAWVISPHLAAENTAKIPSMVIKADDGTILGPVIGYDAGGDRPVVLVEDPTVGGRPVPMIVDKQAFRGAEFQLFYSDTGCGGDVYIRPPADRAGLRKMTGINYAAGLASGDVWLFRGSGSGSSVGYSSVYNSGSADYATPSSGCSNTSGTDDLVSATPVLNLTANYPPPYSAEF